MFTHESQLRLVRLVYMRLEEAVEVEFNQSVVSSGLKYCRPCLLECLSAIICLAVVFTEHVCMCTHVLFSA